MAQSVQDDFQDVDCSACGETWQRKILKSSPAGQSAGVLREIYSKPALQLQTRDIRVLTLLSGTFHSDIQCKLATVYLDDDPGFVALSYCWSDTLSPYNIYINGREISVGSSLERALRHMRRVDADVIVWVDAICINQQDDKEKAVQVALMGDIYAQGIVLRSHELCLLTPNKHHSYGYGLESQLIRVTVPWTLSTQLRTLTSMIRATNYRLLPGLLSSDSSSVGGGDDYGSSRKFFFRSELYYIAVSKLRILNILLFLRIFKRGIFLLQIHDSSQ
jgi:hypothetical protein